MVTNSRTSELTRLSRWPVTVPTTAFDEVYDVVDVPLVTTLHQGSLNNDCPLRCIRHGYTHQCLLLQLGIHDGDRDKKYSYSSKWWSLVSQRQRQFVSPQFNGDCARQLHETNYAISPTISSDFIFEFSTGLTLIIHTRQFDRESCAIHNWESDLVYCNEIPTRFITKF